MSAWEQKFTEALSALVAKHGFRVVGTGYLGRNDGTNTCKDPTFLMERRMFYYLSSGGVAQPYSSAVLWEGSGIIYEDSAFNKDKAVRIGYIPGDTRLHILGYAGVEAFNSTSGQTGVDNKATGGTVTSVALSLPSELSVTGSPVTGAGTLAGAWANARGILPSRAVMFHDIALVVAGNALAITHDANQNHAFYAFQSAAANFDGFTNSFAIKAGTYTFFVLGITGTDCGKIDWKIDGAANFASGQDWYAAGTNYNVYQTVASVTLTAGNHKLSALVNGKNGSSSGYAARLTTYGFYPASD